MIFIMLFILEPFQNSMHTCHTHRCVCKYVCTHTHTHSTLWGEMTNFSFAYCFQCLLIPSAIIAMHSGKFSECRNHTGTSLILWNLISSRRQAHDTGIAWKLVKQKLRATSNAPSFISRNESMESRYGTFSFGYKYSLNREQPISCT